MTLISMSEIKEMSREAYERGKKDGVAEERGRWLPLLKRVLRAFQGDWPKIMVAVCECTWARLPVDDETRDAIIAARNAIRNQEDAE